LLEEYQVKYSNSFPNAYVRMYQLNLTNTPAPIEVRISGDSSTDLKNVAKQVIALGNKNAQVVWARTDWDEMQQAIDVNIKTAEASRLGFSQNDIGNAIAMSRQGLNATQIWEGTYPLNVKNKNCERAAFEY